MPRVLIVDDAAFMRMMLKDILTKNGYEVAGEAENGKVAVSMYQELKPDVTTMDITMPEMDGISAVKEIKKANPGAKIVMVSAMGQQAMVIEAIQAGAADFIVQFDQAACVGFLVVYRGRLAFKVDIPPSQFEKIGGVKSRGPCQQDEMFIVMEVVVPAEQT